MVISTKKLCIIGVLVSTMLFVLMLAYIWNFTIDDAYISFKYSENLASGLGLIWNVNQPPVEGYSNFLWVIIIASILFLKLDPLVFSKIIGLLSVVGIIFLFWLVINDILKNNRHKYIAFTLSTVFILINPYTAIHAVSGMETMLYTFFLLGTMYSAWKTTISDNSRFVWFFSFMSLLLSLTRPEGVLVSLALLFTVFYISYKKKNSIKSLKWYYPVFIVFLIPIIFYNLFRIIYFQELFPLPFYAKVINGFTYPVDLISALFYLIPFISLILISVYIINQNKVSGNLEKEYKYSLLIFVVMIFFANIVFISSPIMNFSQRFYYPSFVLFYLFSGIAISLIFNFVNKIKINVTKKHFIEILVVVFLFLALLESNFYGINELQNTHNYEVDFKNSYIPLGEAIQPFYNDNFTIAFADAGAVAYLSKWKFLDLGGLNDKNIAHNGVSYQYLKEKNPELVILVSVNGEIPAKISYNFVLENNYTRLSPIKRGDYFFIPFIKPNIKDYNKIKESLEKVSINS